MPCRKAISSPVSRIVVNRGPAASRAPQAPLSLGPPLGEGKKGASSTLLSSSDTAHGYLGLKDIPGPRPSVPLVGTAWQYFPLVGRYSLANLHEASVDKFRRYGPVVKEEFQWRHPVVHLYNPEDFETVFRYQGPQPLRPISEFLKHYRVNNPDKYDTPGLANSVGEEWQRLRKVLGPVLLQLNSLDGLLGEMNRICDDFADLLRCVRDPENQLVGNVQEQVYRLSLESIYMMTLESRLGCLERELHPNTAAFSMISSVKLLFEAFQELFFGLPLWKFYQTSSYKKLDKAESTMYEATNSRIQEAIEKLRSESNQRKDNGKPSVLQTLLRTKELTEKEVRVTVIDFISGGIFTVTNAFSFLLYHISRNPEVQEKLYIELIDVAPDFVITSERLARLPYLKACVKESFRLTPTIPCIARILSEDIVASGYHIPAGIPLFCNFMVACKQADKFPNPEVFLPDRWLQKTSRNINPFTLLPFGFGYRMCVGRRFAEMEIYVALAKLVLNFKLENTGQEIKCKQDFIVVPSHPVPVILKDRQ